jgi:hypothetical protein
VTPSHQQIRAAIRNHRQPPRTQGARLRQAIQHAKKKGRVMGPALNDISADETNDVTASADKGTQQCLRKK